jgi:hypothetical protein
MNGNIPGRPDDDEGLDPELMELFDAAKAQASDGTNAAAGGILTPVAAAGLVIGAPSADAFVASLLSRMQRTRRLRLTRQIAGLAIILTGCAFLAPYVAQQTLFAASWLTNQLPATETALLLSQLACACAALLAWRIARRARDH